MDNLSVHKTKRVLDHLKEQDIEPVFNVPYSPELNGIELYWAALKKEYKAEMLQRVIQDGWIDVQ